MSIRLDSRVQEQARTYDDVIVAIRKPDQYAQMGKDAQVEVVELVADLVAGDDPGSAVEKAGPLLEKVVELLSFEVGVAIGMGQADVVDATPPVRLGEARAWMVFASTPFDPNARAISGAAIRPSIPGQLPLDVEMSRQEAAALRWFVKALGTDALHDQFIFLWIALEILVDSSDVRITEPYQCRNGHEIGRCPECDVTTEKQVRGQTMKAYLEQHSLSPAQARDAWALRQIMHGAVPFDSKRLEKLAALVQSLRSVIGSELKARFGLAEGRLPIYEPEGFSIHPSIGGSGTTEATEDLITPL